MIRNQHIKGLTNPFFPEILTFVLFSGLSASYNDASTTYATNTAYHIPTSPYLLMPAGNIAQALAIPPSDTWFSTNGFSSNPTLPCQHHLLCQTMKPNTWLHAPPLWPTLTTSACSSSIWHTLEPNNGMNIHNSIQQSLLSLWRTMKQLYRLPIMAI